MKVSYTWLNQRYFDGSLPGPEKVKELLTMNSFEVESIEKIGSDAIFDVKILPNRSHDCLSHKGIAREISILLSKEFSYKFEKPKTDSSVSTENSVSLTIENGTKCYRATKRLVRDVKVGKSPEWLSNYLTSLGQKPINNIVDCANFVMLETGQPVHTFDFDKIFASRSKSANGKKSITIRNAKDGETIECLDNKTYILDGNAIVISDGKRALDIAGIKGGQTSGINEGTENVLLSACNFESISIRHTSKKLGLRTDASSRFENEITPELVDEAMELLSALVEKISGGKVAPDVIDIYPRRKSKYVVGTSLNEVNKLLGTTMSESAVATTLTRARFEYKIVDPIKELLFLAPKYVGVPYKLGSSIIFDAPQLFDCSSFVSYLYVQSGISIPRMTIDQYVFGESVDLKSIQPGDLLFFSKKNTESYYKTIEFMPGTPVPSGIDHVALYLGDDVMIHANSKSGKVTEESFEKSSSREFFVGARRIVLEKSRRFVVTVPYERLDIRIKEDLIEEIQRLAGYKNIKGIKTKISKKSVVVDKNLFYQNKIRNILTGHGFSEIYTYAFDDKGEVEILNPIASNKNFLRKTLGEGIEESLARNINYADLLGTEQIKVFEMGNVFYSSGKESLSLAIAVKNRPNVKGDAVKKELEEVSNKLRQELGVSSDAFEGQKAFYGNVIEINLAELIKSLPTPSKYDISGGKKWGGKSIKAPNYQYTKISQYPFIARDIAVFVPKKIPSEKVLQKIMKMSGSLLVKYRLFDVFTKKFPDGNEKTSYAFRLVFQSDDRTLTDEEINKIMDGVTTTLNSERGWQVR